MHRVVSMPMINNNHPPYYFPSSNGNMKVKRIQPNKFTFLNSNLMVSNILYQKKNRSSQEIQYDDTKVQIPDAYVACKLESQKYADFQELQTAKINKVKQQAKASLRQHFQDKKTIEKTVDDHLSKIKIMKQQMMDRAGQIMAKREDSQYTGRRLDKTGAKMLKECKQKDPTHRLFKVQSTRKVMKDKTKQNERRKNMSLQNNLHDSQSQSVSSSMADMSTIFSQVQKQKAAESHQHSILQKMLRNKSYDQVFSEQRRRGVCQGFMKNWKNGQNNIGTNLILKKTTKKLHLQNREHRQKSEHDDQRVYLGSDKSKRYFGLSEYTKNFDQLATAYTISSR